MTYKLGYIHQCSQPHTIMFSIFPFTSKVFLSYFIISLLCHLCHAVPMTTLQEFVQLILTLNLNLYIIRENIFKYYFQNSFLNCKYLKKITAALKQYFVHINNCEIFGYILKKKKKTGPSSCCLYAKLNKIISLTCLTNCKSQRQPGIFQSLFSS